MSNQQSLSTEDRIAIADLFAAYAWALDTGDVDALAACFTEDGEVVEEVFEDPDHWRGREGVRALGRHYACAANFPGRQHHIGQSRFLGGSERCTAQSYVFVTECHGEPPYTLRFAGYYDDVLVKQDGAWLIAKRAIRLWDGPVLARFPGRGTWQPRKRPPELVVKKG
jgi:uncharacterized protein (TIGR02246 family)